MADQQRQQPRRVGRRLRALGDAFHRTVKYALRPLDYEAFAEQFPSQREALVQELYAGYKQVWPVGRRGCIRLSLPPARTSRRTPSLHYCKQVLHQARTFIESDFGELCEEHALRDKLNTLEALCEEQGIADGDTAEATRCARDWPARCCVNVALTSWVGAECLL